MRALCSLIAHTVRAFMIVIVILSALQRETAATIKANKFLSRFQLTQNKQMPWTCLRFPRLWDKCFKISDEAPRSLYCSFCKNSSSVLKLFISHPTWTMNGLIIPKTPDWMRDHQPGISVIVSWNKRLNPTAVFYHKLSEKLKSQVNK